MNTPIRYIVIAAMLIMPITLAAQKKQINQARDILKEGKEPQKAEQIMTLLNQIVEDFIMTANERGD